MLKFFWEIKKMNKKNRETEIKFKINRVEEIIQNLKKIGCKFEGKAFEKTIRFDTPSDELEKEGKFLRLRSGFKNVLTYKSKIENKQFKEREEIEIEVLHPEKIKLILEKLGFTKIKIMEKYRQKWSGGNVEIVIDKLPFGFFLEIEGKRSDITKTVSKLGLKMKNSSTKTYWDLWKEFSRKEGIKDENIVFNLNKN